MKKLLQKSIERNFLDRIITVTLTLLDAEYETFSKVRAVIEVLDHDGKVTGQFDMMYQYEEGDTLQQAEDKFRDLEKFFTEKEILVALPIF